MSALESTRHAMTRLAQRAIGDDDVDLIMLIATEVEGGYFVRDKDAHSLEHRLRELAERVGRLAGKRLVVADGHLVTGYHARPAVCRRLLRSESKWTRRGDR